MSITDDILADDPTVTMPSNIQIKTPDLLRTLPLKYIGNVNIVGDCFCFGLAVEYTPDTHRPYPIYLNIAGAATSVEGAWARLVQGKEMAVVPMERDTSSIPLHPPDKGLYIRLQRRIDGVGMDNLILLHRQLAQPSFTDNDLAFLMALDDEQACLRLAQYVKETVKIAVFPQWGHYLRQQGHQSGLLQPRTSYEGVDFWTIKLNAADWTALICEGLRKGALRLP